MKLFLLTCLQPVNGHFNKTVIACVPSCGKRSEKFYTLVKNLLEVLNSPFFRETYGYCLSIGKDRDHELRSMGLFSLFACFIS